MSEDMTGDVSGWSPDPSDPAPDEAMPASDLGEPVDEPIDAQGDEPLDEPDLAAAAPQVPLERTGNPVVDSVLDSLRDLDNLPVSEHVAVFEAAHDRLRNALSDAGDPRTDG